MGPKKINSMEAGLISRMFAEFLGCGGILSRLLGSMHIADLSQVSWESTVSWLDQ